MWTLYEFKFQYPYVLSAHAHTHSLMHYLWLLFDVQVQRSVVEQGLYGPQNLTFLLPHPLQPTPAKCCFEWFSILALLETLGELWELPVPKPQPVPAKSACLEVGPSL